MNGNKIIAEDLDIIINAQLNWASFSNKNVLITGANGFLPAYLVETLLHLIKKGIINNTIIFALVRNIEKAKKRFKPNKNLHFIVQDVCDPISIEEPLHFIIHAASQASPKYYGTDPVGTLNANVLGTTNLLKLAKENPIESFLYFSSSEVYGCIDCNRNPIKENDFGYIDPTNVRSCYAEGKRMGETICVSWAQQYNIPVKIVRPFHTYGPGMDLNDGRVYADFINNVLSNTNIVMKSDGLAKRAFCYLSDATIAFYTVLLKGEQGNAYNVGNPDGEISIIDLATKLVDMFPEKKLSVIKSDNQTTGYLKSSVLRNCPDLTKIKNLGWSPKVDINNGLYRTIKSYEQIN
jgi:UDP-glucuronate decarboxylase